MRQQPSQPTSSINSLRCRLLPATLGHLVGLGVGAGVGVGGLMQQLRLGTWHPHFCFVSTDVLKNPKCRSACTCHLPLLGTMWCIYCVRSIRSPVSAVDAARVSKPTRSQTHTHTQRQRERERERYIYIYIYIHTQTDIHFWLAPCSSQHPAQYFLRPHEYSHPKLATHSYEYRAGCNSLTIAMLTKRCPFRFKAGPLTREHPS